MNKPPIQFCRRLPPEIQISKNMNHHTKHKQTNTRNALLGSPPLSRRKSKQSHGECSASHSIPKPLGRASQSHMARRDLEKPGNSASWGKRLGACGTFYTSDGAGYSAWQCVLYTQPLVAARLFAVVEKASSSTFTFVFAWHCGV